MTGPFHADRAVNAALAVASAAVVAACLAFGIAACSSAHR